MRPIYSNAPVLVEEALNDISTKHVAGSTTRKLKALGVGVWVRPHEISEGALVWNLFDAFDFLDIIDVLKRGRKTCVHTEDSPINDRC